MFIQSPDCIMQNEAKRPPVKRRWRRYTNRESRW